jgi:O-antigen/teichoic acid export membrane protein
VSRIRIFIRNISWNYVSAIAEILVFFILTPIVVKHLGATVYAIWVLLHVIVFYLNFFDLGLYTALVKFVARFQEVKDMNSLNEVIGSTLTMMTVAGIAAFITSLILAWLFVPYYFDVTPEMLDTLKLAVMLFGIKLLISFPGSVFRAIFEGYQRYDVLGVINTILTVMTAVGIYIAIRFFDAGILLLAIVEIASAITGVIVYLFFVARMFPEITPAYQGVGGENWQRMRSYSWWVAFNEMLAEGASRIDRLLIPVFLSVAMVTPYVLICSVAGAIFLMIGPISEVFFSLSSAIEARDDKAKLRTLLLKGTKLVMGFSLPVAVAAMAYGEAFLNWWVGAEYVALDGPVLELVVASYVVYSFIIIGYNILMALSRLQGLFVTSLIEAIIATILAVLTLPEYGLTGLAGSLLVANSLVTFLLRAPYFCRVLDQNIAEYLLDSLLRPLLPVIPAVATVYVINQVLVSEEIAALVIKGVIVGSVYFVSFYFLSLSKDEKDEYGGHIREMILGGQAHG